MHGKGWKEHYLGDSADHEADKLARLFSHQRSHAIEPAEAAQAESERLRQIIDDTNHIQRAAAEPHSQAAAGNQATAHQQRLGSAHAHRALHAKAHLGLTSAHFQVAAELPEHLQSEVFTPGMTYPAWLRFSSAASSWSSDEQRGVHGLAVRLFYGEDNRREQDLLATNGATSHARNALDFITSMRTLAGRNSTVKRLLGLLKLALFPRALGGGGAAGARMAWLLLRGSRIIQSLGTETYWSRTAFALGSPEASPVALKYRFVPRMATRDHNSPPRGENHLRNELLQRLSEDELIFDLQVQLYQDETSTPIEDATIPWPEASDQFVTLGRLVIPAPLSDKLGDEETAIEQCAFNPWRSAEDFRPIGGLNRARRFAYQASADLRQGRRSCAASPPHQHIALWLLEKGFDLINRVIPWHRMPRLVGLANLAAIRNKARRDNMRGSPRTPLQAQQDSQTSSACPALDTPPRKPSTTHPHPRRSADGSNNDLLEPSMGKANSPFARNMGVVDNPRLLDPNPLEISRRLLRREQFSAVDGLNYLVPAWTQFQVHDWVGHNITPTEQRAKDDLIHIEDPGHDDSLARMSPARTKPADVPEGDDYPGAPSVFDNIQTHWWDASQLYGVSDARQRALRSDDGQGCKLRVNTQGLLDLDPQYNHPVDLTGVNRGYWLGLSLLHTLFSLEHNAICDALKEEHSNQSDEWIFQTARLINAALIAKIHTLEWSRAVLDTPILDTAFRTYWEGAEHTGLSERLGKLVPDDVWRGLPGSATQHFGVPFAQTEEFAACYRMHSMLRDELPLHSHQTGGDLGKLRLKDKIGPGARAAMETHGPESLFYSFGIAAPGQLCLGNYPDDMRRLTLEVENESTLDVGALDILRDRERGIPRYNDFRAALNLPKCRSFEELSSDPKWQRELESVYAGKIDDVDLMIGMLAERAPEGFGISETAFRIFIVNAAQRFHSDRFYSTDFNASVYTERGMQWIQNNTFSSVLLRHYPELEGAINPDNPFKTWLPVSEARQHADAEPASKAEPSATPRENATPRMPTTPQL